MLFVTLSEYRISAERPLDMVHVIVALQLS